MRLYADDVVPGKHKTMGIEIEEPMTDDTHPSRPKKQLTFGPCSNSPTMTWVGLGGHAMVRHANRRSTCTVSGALGDNNPTPEPMALGRLEPDASTLSFPS